MRLVVSVMGVALTVVGAGFVEAALVVVAVSGICWGSGGGHDDDGGGLDGGLDPVF